MFYIIVMTELDHAENHLPGEPDDGWQSKRNCSRQQLIFMLLVFN